MTAESQDNNFGHPRLRCTFRIDGGLTASLLELKEPMTGSYHLTSGSSTTMHRTTRLGQIENEPIFGGQQDHDQRRRAVKPPVAHETDQWLHYAMHLAEWTVLFVLESPIEKGQLHYLPTQNLTFYFHTHVHMLVFCKHNCH